MNKTRFIVQLHVCRIHNSGVMRRWEKFLILQSSAPSDGKSDSIVRIGSFERFVSKNWFENYVILLHHYYVIAGFNKMHLMQMAMFRLRVYNTLVHQVLNIFPVRLHVGFFQSLVNRFKRFTEKIRLKRILKIATAQIKEVGRALSKGNLNDCCIVSVFILFPINNRSVLSDWRRDIQSNHISWLASCLVSYCNPNNGLIAFQESHWTIGSDVYVCLMNMAHLTLRNAENGCDMA